MIRMYSNRQKKQLKTAISGGFALIMLFIYLTGAIQFNILHASFHAHTQEELHSPENEKEACHKAIYHQDQAGSCHHKTHLVAHDQCSLCHLIVSMAQPLFQAVEDQLFVHNSPIQINRYLHYPQEIIFLLPSRAPPVC